MTEGQLECLLGLVKEIWSEKVREKEIAEIDGADQLDGLDISWAQGILEPITFVSTFSYFLFCSHSFAGSS